MIMKILNVINFIVFLLATVLVASIFYEGLTLRWYDFVPVFIILTDVFFMFATILNLLFNRKNKVILYLNVFSVILISITLILKFFNIEHPRWGVTVWFVYILYFYGTQVIVNVYKYIHRAKKG